MNETHSFQSLNEAIARAEACSPFLRQQMERFPVIVEQLRADGLDAALAEARRAGEGLTVSAALRRERSGFALALGLADLAGMAPLERVTAELSRLADRVMDQAVAAIHAERTPQDEARGFTVIALGKQGGCELNYSSDVDLILLFDPLTLPTRPREEPSQSALRIAQKFVELLQKRTEEGYAFRVDLRLRPASEVTPIVLPVNAAISHYESSALPWERAAFIRARYVAGDAALGAYFLDAIQPFVWRRSLDFGAMKEITSITHRIRDHYAQGQALGPGFDVKRGRGGIREIEFFTQIHQLIHGGREPALRLPATLDALPALAAAGRIGDEEAKDLRAAYCHLRTVEHRLQMVDDRQTHQLPVGQEALDNVARLSGLENGEALIATIAPYIARVDEIYATLEPSDAARLSTDAPALERRLAELGFSDPPVARGRIENWRSGRIRSLRTGAALEAFEAMLPGLVEAFSKGPDPIRAMNRFEDLLDRLPTGVNFYRLLEARPALAQHLVTILSLAPALADELGRRPALLDGLVDSTALAAAGPVDQLEREFAPDGEAANDYQRLLDHVRRRVNERRFSLGVQLITLQADPLDVAAGYARVAEAAIGVLGRAAVADFESQRGRVPGSELIILGLGRLGGEALTFASDLDLIYVFSGTHEAQSDDKSPLRATDYFNRLAPRVTAALSVATAAGPLYEVDTRLRPNGTDGLIAVSVDSFEHYQRDQAWTWEHMALLRARPVFGSPEGRERVQAIIADIWHKPRDPLKVTADVVKMRGEIAAHKPPTGPFDIKHGQGGLIDFEFAVHCLQLRHGTAFHPRLDRALQTLIEQGLAPPTLAPHFELLSRLLVLLRLMAPQGTEPAPAMRDVIASACSASNWDELLAAVATARQSVSRFWQDVAGWTGE